MSSNPDGAWVTQQARTLEDEGAPRAFLIRDRDSKYSRSFDDILRTKGIGVIRTPVRAPRAKSHAPSRVL